MALEGVVDSLDSVPEALREHYTQQDGKYVLNANGFVPKTKLDEFRSNNINLLKEKEELQKRYDGVDPEAYRKYLEEKQAAKDKKLIDEGKVEELLNERVAKMKSDYDTQVKNLSEGKTQAEQQLEKLLVDNALAQAAAAAGVRNTAVEDVLRRGRDMFKVVNGQAVPFKGDQIVYGKDGVTPLSMNDWLGELSASAPHLFNASTGGGALGNHGGGAAGNATSKSQLKSASDKVAFIQKHGMDAYLSLAP